MRKKLYLVLENGEIFTGQSFGAYGETVGEAVFTTAMTGYNETITDPSYCGQIVIQTFPLIGNYGVISEDFESRKPFLKAYIVKDICEVPSNFRSEGTLENYLCENNIVGLCGIDTRALTRMLRRSGTMNAKITADISDIGAITEELKQYRVQNSVETVSVNGQQTYAVQEPLYNVVLWDFGAKANICRELLKRGCNVTVIPQDTAAEEINKIAPDGIMLSNGPGDPSDNVQIISEIKKVSDSKIPMFGICLGHQLLALSNGAKTEKLKYGHRGANQPVKDILQSGRVYITSQNHGYAVKTDSLPDNAKLYFENVNDKTCEGIMYTDTPAFSVQFHPEACGGPHDTNFLFDKFIDMIREVKENAAQ